MCAANVATNILKGTKSENNLYNLMGIEEDIHPLSYTNVPSFEQNNRKPFQTVIVHFRNKEDLEKFAKLVEQPNLTLDGKRDKKSTWFPSLEHGERGQNSLCVWADEDDQRVQKLMEQE